LLQRAFAKICGGRIVVHGAGRTDAGVHALAQCAHVDVPERKIDWLSALNANLPREIRVERCSRVRDDFHARFSAKGKIYRYRIWNAPVLSPFEHGRAWHLPGTLDFDRLKNAAILFEGTHDFAAFAANRGKPVNDTTRTIFKVTVQRRQALLTLTFDGSGFLYKMVRLMTGTLVRVAQGHAEPRLLTNLLAGKLKTSFAAPAEGLYLVRVRY
jgi:tRNA pseudouridine38-40 synthase